jgi:hypothetical protein
VSSGPGRFAVSVPCVVPLGSVQLSVPSRGSRVRDIGKCGVWKKLSGVALF